MDSNEKVEFLLSSLDEFIKDDSDIGYIFIGKDDGTAEIAVRDCEKQWHHAYGSVEDMQHFNFFMQVAMDAIKNERTTTDS